MFKKIKNYFSLKRRIQREVLETLCSICLYLDQEGRYSRNYHARHMRGHFTALKELSDELKGKEK